MGLGKSLALDGDGWEGGAVHVDISNGIVLEYDTFGDPDDPAILLVMGFGTQLLGWDPEFCRLLASRGRYVIRYDNRDCGLSTKYDDVPVDLMDFIGAVTSGDVDRAQAMSPYSLLDMASDGNALLRELGVDRAHVVGSSMGGMIAQKMAAVFPDQVLSLTSMIVDDRGAGVRPVHPRGPAGPVLPAARRP